MKPLSQSMKILVSRWIDPPRQDLPILQDHPANRAQINNTGETGDIRSSTAATPTNSSRAMKGLNVETEGQGRSRETGHEQQRIYVYEFQDKSALLAWGGPFTILNGVLLYFSLSEQLRTTPLFILTIVSGGVQSLWGCILLFLAFLRHPYFPVKCHCISGIFAGCQWIDLGIRIGECHSDRLGLHRANSFHGNVVFLLSDLRTG